VSKHKRKRNDRKAKRTRRQRSSTSSRKLFAMSLHRSPCLWDTLIHELALDLSNQCRKTRHHLSTESFWFSDQETTIVGMMLAKGFEIFISRPWPAGLDENLRKQIRQIDESTAAQISESTVSQCFDPLLRKYVEDIREIYPGRPHGDLDILTADLQGILNQFLVLRCSDKGNLYQCLQNPLGNHNRYFPDNGRRAETANSCGDPVQDVYRLGLLVDDDDDGGDIKRKLVHFVRNDPWLFAEVNSFVQHKLENTEENDRIDDTASAIDEATDEFIFRATRLNGKTPIELFMERQNDMSELQKIRLLRWDTETFCGTFMINETEFPFINTIDIPTDKSYRLTATLPETLRSLKCGDLIFSRIIPWDDHWLLSGIQRIYHGVGNDQQLVSKLKLQAQRKPIYRPGDSQSPRIQEGFKVQEAQHKAWMDLYGQEELIFEDGLELGAAMNRFHRYWRDEIPFDDTGMSRSEHYRQRLGQPPPEVKFPLPDYMLEAKDTAVVFDRQHGFAFYIGYGLFLSAFEQQGSLTDEQVQRVWDYLIDESTDYWLFQRIQKRFPERTEYVFREVLKDKYFQIDRDFDAVLRKFKGQAMRRPPRPMITVVNTETDSKNTSETIQ